MNHFSNQIRHNRVLDIRKKILSGWSMKQLHDFCKTHLDVAKVTADSYIDEAAAPYRKKYEQESNLKEKISN